MQTRPRPWTTRSSISLLSLSIASMLLGCPGDDGSGVASTTTEGTTGASTSAGTTEAADADSSTGHATDGDVDLPFPPAGPDAAPDPSAMGPYPVGVRTVELLDESRPDDTGAPRQLITEIWYPATEAARDEPGFVYTLEDILTPEAFALVAEPVDAEIATSAVRDAAERDDGDRFPIVLFSHGSSGVRMQSTFLTVYLASHGYVVAAPDHKGNTLSDAIILEGDTTASQLESLGLRPDDMGFVLEYLQDLGDEDPLGAILERNRVGAAGHSFGALTTLRLLAQDRPIDVAVAQAPPSYEVTWLGALANQPEDITVPVMLHAGTADATTPLADAESIFDRLTAPRTLLTVRDAGHFTFSDMCTLDAAAIEAATQIGLSQALDDGCAPENIDPAIALPLQRHFAIGLFNGHLRDSPGSLDLLTQEAGEALAPGMLELQHEP